MELQRETAILHMKCSLIHTIPKDDVLSTVEVKWGKRKKI